MLRQGLVVCACAVFVTADYQPWRIINTDQGPVKGYRPVGEDYFAFFGIPYATTPTGPNKFKAPLPPPIWKAPFEAIQKNIVCPQPVRDTNVVLNFQEDCLITNIYIPDTEAFNLSVVVYFHGGAYQYGYGNIKTAINLLKSKKIIVVNFNYRIGAHGLLCLGTEDVPGNAGMKDQIALLRWVQRNIANFGGNPNDVTIDGWSAGSSSVDLVMISKMARGLFHKVIPESGSSTASFSVQVDPIANAKMIARQVNFTDVDNLKLLEDFYKHATFDVLYAINVNYQTDSSTVFAPCVERDLGQEMFLDDYPVNILKSGNYPKVPMLFGITEMEGIYRTGIFESWSEMMNNKFDDFLPEDLTFESEKQREQVAREIKQFYFGEKPVNEKNILKYIEYFTDVMFGHGTAKGVKLQVEAGNDQIYLYIYAYADENDDYILYTNKHGATHCAQTAAVMDLGDEKNLSETYRSVKKFMRELWLNFITTGNPVPQGSSHPAWPPVGMNRTAYMYINDTLKLKKSFLGDRGLFWDNIYDKYYRPPSPPAP